MKRHLLPQRAHYYKANLHMHTTLSDGRMTPEEVKEAYKNQGYSILAYTDHEAIVPHNDLRDESFLPITSFEIATGEQTEGLPAGSNRTYHLNLYAKDPQNAVSSAFMVDYIWGKIEHIRAYISEEQFRHGCQRTYSVACMNDIIARAKEEGFLVSYNHPTWSLQDENDYAELKGVWGVEVYNTGCDRMGYLDTVHPMETLLRRGEFVFPLATDDAHKLSDCFGGWTMVGADRLEYSDVMQALENGDFYASTGPEIHELSIEDGKLRVVTSPAASVILSTERRFSKRVDAKEDEPLTVAEFDLTAYLEQTQSAERKVDSYVRVTVLNGKGKTAWSRAYRVEELSNINA